MVEESGREFVTTPLYPPRSFVMAEQNEDVTPASITCKRTVALNTHLHVRHGISLELRNLRWLVTDQPICQLFLGHPVFEALGMHCKNILFSAANLLNGVYDAMALNQDALIDERVFLLTEGIFHGDGGADNADEKDKSIWIDLGPERSGDRNGAILQKMDKAKKAGITPDGKTRLDNFLCIF